jgi:hypothetical protein
MADNDRAEANQSKMKLSHVSLIKLLVVEELRWLGRNWDSFLLVAGIPKDRKGDFPPPTERVTSHCMKAGVGNVAQEGRTLEALSPQQKIPRRRGRTRKSRDAREA